ncbi:kinase-like domain-containing protein [Calycina marina]|uniref:Kinase-like domain-containing protein n=1 Tax=Calycina marina TaxID=1763456 RepID=A0A9P7Z7R9_9HELO|nr:kinase-like domain-containing protein [Calycina marina]
MAPRTQLKHGRDGGGETGSSKKPKMDEAQPIRRSQRLAPPGTTPISQKQQLPSPITQQESTSSSDAYKEGTATPPGGRPSQPHPQALDFHASLQEAGLSSPPQDTQAFSQFMYPTSGLSNDVKDEEKEGVWGYLLPLDQKLGKSLVLRKRNACPLLNGMENFGKDKGDRQSKNGKNFAAEEDAYEQTKLKGVASGGYLIGRHPECDLIIDDPIISNRHCLLFTENKGGETIAVIEDLSSNGTFVNEAVIGRNKRREMKDQDEISVPEGHGRFIFRYPKNRQTSPFLQKYTLLEKLGKGHFAEVFLCIEKSTGQRYAVKIFTKRPGLEERSKTEGLQQEIAVLMGVSHPNMLCLKDTFDEPNAVYLVLELAAEGELFNWIVMKQKLTEAETRKVFIQLFQGIKYLHERGIVHRDIKPENILLTDKDLHVKVADFGLAKIIGEESFTTTLCGTPSYVAPEILEESRQRRYTRAVDVWSLGVVLYICLCGFPPFSDELYSKQNPYNLTQQIKTGHFDYPSPYWDSIGDPALDLIDRMLTVDVKKRFTIDECLEHPWTTQKPVSVNDSTDGLVGAIAGLDFSKRKMARERTLLSSINDLKVTRTIDIEPDKTPVRIYVKNPPIKESQNKVNQSLEAHANGAPKSIAGPPKQEETPSHNRDPDEFMRVGGKGDEVLYGNEDSIYPGSSDDSGAVETTKSKKGVKNGKA